MNEQPSREFDAQVHRALWSDDEVQWLWSYEAQGKIYLYKGGEILDGLPDTQKRPLHLVDGRWVPIPFYTTDLAAWDGVGDELGWFEASEDATQVQVYWRLYPYDGNYIYAEATYEEAGGNRFAAQALARSRCVLQLAERREGD